MQVLAHALTPGSNGSEAPFLLSLTGGDRNLISLGIETVRQVIDDIEFRTRLDVLPAEADALLVSLRGGDAERPTAAPRAVPPAVETGETVMAMTESQLMLVNNALNEGLHGLRANEVPLPLRTADARALLDAVDDILGEAGAGASIRVGPERRYVDFIR